jgi:RHH-type transcriptional regulator, proline utilization regulon repressor / proline dehydrogenase / delta 1-pyrroline-5-carboxylate dehydrogenase
VTFVELPRSPQPQRAAVEAASFATETSCVEALVAEADLGIAARERIQATARQLVERIRTRAADSGGLDAFMHEYDLSSREGVMLMCLAEALLRIPDAATADRLIAEKIGGADWQKHLGESGSLFVNASTWALMLTGRLVRLDDADVHEPRSALRRLVSRGGEPVIRQAMLQAMRIIGRQFVMGRTIEEALGRARDTEAHGYQFSYDMLGESAHTQADAERYLRAYTHAIDAVGRAAKGRGPSDAPGISIKLSALHPRFERAQLDRVHRELIPRVATLARQAKAAGIGLCIDTEEADRLDITLDVLEAVFLNPAVTGWEGIGIAVQAYQKRARPLINWLSQLAKQGGRRLAVRLVKGAYWDAEIKHAQEWGLDSYHVFTRKANTDVSYIACARRLFAEPDAFRPAFATHNAQTLAAVLELGRGRDDFEFQRLHGMGEALYDPLVAEADPISVSCRIYAPVGSHADLLCYLVRRLLENGSNTSFVNRIVDERLPVDDIIADPVSRVASLTNKPHPRIPLPRQLYGTERLNAAGIDLASGYALCDLAEKMNRVELRWTARPLVGGEPAAATAERDVRDPADRRRVVGTVNEAAPEAIEAAFRLATSAARWWAARPVEERAACLDRVATAMEQDCAELMALCVREAGKTLPDALAEVREAVDFCRYYAARARVEFAHPVELSGPTGETNHLMRRGRGVFVCISPWNFPLAIFIGQVAAALVSGNAVIAKPAEQTPLIAMRAVRMLHAAGVPPEVLTLLPGDGHVGAGLVSDVRVGGVAFTGSVETAHAINRLLAGRKGPIVPLIAETGGLNAMIVDSSALAEQVVSDVIASAFRSAGQRCSALRVLFVQREAAAKIKSMLAGAMAELRLGDPGLLATDIGPVIDEEAHRGLHAHAERMRREGRVIYEATLPEDCAEGTFFAPCAYGIDHLNRLDREVFGPILHIVEFASDQLDAVLEAVDATGYGLTLGLHSRVDSFVRRVCERLRVGNIYVNRNMIGAVVGVQPFGGERLSGTGPKAGGPWYLHRFATERTLTVNTSAAGGNAALLSLSDTEND